MSWRAIAPRIAGTAPNGTYCIGRVDLIVGVNQQKSVSGRKVSGNGPSLVRNLLPTHAPVEPVARPDHLWLAIYLPYLPLESLGHGNNNQAIAVYEQQGQTQQIVTPNQQAQENGVRPGMTLAVAQTLAPALKAVVRDTAAEKIQLTQFAIKAACWTPAITVLEDGLLLDIAGSLRLYGGTQSLLGQIRSWITDKALLPCIALTPTPASALLCARAGKSICVSSQSKLNAAVRTLPAQMLATHPKQHRLLMQLGIRTIGDLQRLPRNGLARRLGPDIVGRLDKLLGQAPDPQAFFTLPPEFTRSATLPAEGVEAPFLLPFIERLLVRLENYLYQHHILVEHLYWCLAGAKGPLMKIPVPLTRPCRDTQHLLSLSQLAFETVQTTNPITKITLQVHRFTRATQISGGLFQEMQSDANDGSTLVERLQSRLGPAVVYGICIQADHRPEKAWRHCTPGETGLLPGGAQRPLWLLEAPRPAQASQGLLQQLDCRERICSGWWDDHPVRRDYYQNTTSVIKTWIFRDLNSGQWHLHGIF